MPPTVHPLPPRPDRGRRHNHAPSAGRLPAWFSRSWRRIAVQVHNAGRDQGRQLGVVRHDAKDFWALHLLFQGEVESLDAVAGVRRSAPCSWLIPPGHPSGQRQFGTGDIDQVTCLFSLHRPVLDEDPLWLVPQVSAVMTDPSRMRFLTEELLAWFHAWNPLDADAILHARSAADRLIWEHVLAAMAVASIKSIPRQVPPQWFTDLCARMSHDMLDADYGFRQIISTAGVSPSLVSRTFRRLHGITALGFLRRLRVEMAARLLSNRPDCQIAEIAVRCGYRSLPMFSRHFSAVYGCPPGRWRRGVTDVQQDEPPP